MADAQILSREAILSSCDLARETVDVPEWGGPVIVREMTVADRTEWEDLTYEVQEDGEEVKVKVSDKRLYHASVVAYSVVDGDGGRLFGKEDIPALAGKSYKAVRRIFAVAARLSGIGRQAERDAEKN